MAYITCSNCGAKALEIATLCPRCQRPFPSREERRASQPVQKPAPKAPWYMAGLAVLVVAGVWIAWSTARQAAADKQAAAARVIPVEAVPAPDTATTAMLDSTALIPAPVLVAPAPVAPAPVAPAPARAEPTVELPRASAPKRSAPPESGTWQHGVVTLPVNVRKKSARGAKVLLVLAKGDTVLVGEQITGWTHVRVDGIDGWVDSRRLSVVRTRR
ncbi:MAG: SH3 domain-containing protein [Gemmatimonadetes bacterium]|nr:SH3 domain-containing protein [Gemmatimonadota bacterium]